MELRPYQREDVDFLKKLNAAACFNEQRTGKTPTIFTVVHERRLPMVLFITVKSALKKQAKEYETWTGKPCVVLQGTHDAVVKRLNQWTHGAVISFGTLKETQKSIGMVDEILKKHPQCVIVDEAHKIKSRDAAVTKAVFKLKNVPVRYVLTGTPANGRNHEIWPILHFLYPKYFRSYWKFIDEFFEVKEKFNPIARKKYTEIGDFISETKRAQLQNILNQFCTQRKRKDVMPWLPEKDYDDPVKLECTKEQRKAIEELKEFYETGEVVVKGVLDRLVRYRQICAAPKLLDLPGKSPKIDWLKDYLSDYPDKPVIIFTKFTSFIELIQKEINIPSITGSTSVKQRHELIQRFQNGEIKALLLNIDACKEAITLDTAECAIFLDKYPPAGDVSQAEDRFVSTTPDKADKPHEIIEVMMEDTYDEQLFDLVRQRAEETDVINNFKQYLRR